MMTVQPGVRESYRRLASAQKPGSGVPFYMRAVNRRLGRLIAASAAQSGITPNQVTALSGLVFLAGIALLVGRPPSIWIAAGVVIALEGAFALDAADGQLARLTGRGSLAGEWLDHVVDAARLLLLHLAVAVALTLHADVDRVWLLVPMAFGVAASVRFFGLTLAEKLTADSGSQPTTRPGSGWVQSPADAGIINLVFLLWPWTSAFLAGYAILAAANVALLLATLARKYRALAAEPS
jgi:phosphatidylglycerophosphate synthase